MKLGIILICAAAAAVIVLEVIVVSHRSRIPAVIAETVPVPAPQAQVVTAVTPLPAIPQPPAQEEKELDLELLGTLLSGKFPCAFIKDKKAGGSRLCRIGNKIQGASVVGIGKGEVTLLAGGKRRRLVMAGSSQQSSSSGSGSFIEPLAPGVLVVKTGVLVKERNEIFQELRKVKVSPHYENKKVSGLRIDGIAENSIITCAGIRNNDVIREVNNQRIDSYQKALQVFIKARRQPEIKVNLVREGTVKELSYHLQ